MIADECRFRRLSATARRLALHTAFLLCMSEGALAQEPSPFALSLEELLNVKVVTAGRREQRPFDSPRSISIVTAADLRRRNYRSTPEAIQELAGVLLQQTNDGGGSPIIRGLTGNQVLLLIDGIRLNNAIYRFGPNQYLNTIDIEQVERIEVIRGPGSVLFGSDALGGVINIITKSRVIGDSQPNQLELHARTATADRGSLGRIGFNAGAGRLMTVGGVSLKSFGQIRSGHSTVQTFTGYDEWAGDLKVSAAVRTGETLTVSAQRLEQSDVVRADALGSGSDLEWRWDPQSRSLVSLQYANTRGWSFVREATAFAAYQDQHEQTSRRTTASPGTRRYMLDGVRSASTGVQFYSAATRQELTYGADWYVDRVRSTRTDETIATGVLVPRRGTFADGASRFSGAVYLQDRLHASRRLTLDVGGRYEWIDLEALLADPAAGVVDIDARNRALTGSAYASYALAPALKIVGGVSNGFRAPNVDDVSVFGSFGGGFEIPNPALTPERSINRVVGLKVFGQRAALNLSAFDVSYRGLIVRAPATYLDLPYLDLNGSGRRESSEPLVFSRQNIGSAAVRGVEVDGQIYVGRAWRATGTFGWTRGTDKAANEPLRRVPPPHGSISMMFDPGQRWWVEGYSVFAGAQRRLNSLDIVDVRIGPNGTAGFGTLNIRSGVNLSGVGIVTLGLENLLDTRYKWHGSGIERPGRNVVVGVRRTF